MQNKKLVSVVIPVYNAQAYLSEAINSVLYQSYKNLEIICVDDSSTDNSWAILTNFRLKDPRIKLFRLQKNQGLSAALNVGISNARSQFIARMDADDIMTADRIEKQLNFLLTNPDNVAVGGQCIRINEQGERIGIKSFPLSHKEITAMIFRSSPLQHPTLMVNKNNLPKNFTWYDESFRIAEDYDLYYRLMKYGKLANLADVVLYYREHPHNLTLNSQKSTFWYITRSRFKAITRYGYIPSIGSLLNVFIQFIAVILLPEKILYKIHMTTRTLFFKSSYNQKYV